MTEELPKQELLLKLLGLTASANDAEALSAIRKANEFLNRAGWTWEMLIHSKIKIIPSPFIGVGDPRTDRHAEPAEAPPFTPRPPKMRPTPPPPPPRPDAWSFADGIASGPQRPAQRPQMGPQNAGPLPRKPARNKYRPGIGEL